MVFVDSSIWIGYFSNGSHGHLTDLILEDNIVAINDIILTELIPFLIHHDANEAVSSLQALDQLPLEINWQAIQMLQSLNLKNCVNKVGIPDLIIAQNALQNGVEIWTEDKHFGLMAEFTNLRLYQG